MPLYRRTAGWRTTEEDPAPPPPQIQQPKAWTADNKRTFFIWIDVLCGVDYWPGAVADRLPLSPPYFYLCCKMSGFRLQRLNIQAAPFKSPCFDMARPLLTWFKVREPFGGESCSSALVCSLSLSATIPEKHQPFTPVFYITNSHKVQSLKYQRCFSPVFFSLSLCIYLSVRVSGICIIYFVFNYKNQKKKTLC